MSAIHSAYAGDREYIASRAATARRVSLIETLVIGIARMAERRRSRRALLSMSDAQLKDIGISRADAEREGLRNPWE